MINDDNKKKNLLMSLRSRISLNRLSHYSFVLITHILPATEKTFFTTKNTQKESMINNDDCGERLDPFFPHPKRKLFFFFFRYHPNRLHQFRTFDDLFSSWDYFLDLHYSF